MAIKVLMPKMSFIVTEGTILEWLKSPGDQVNKGEPLLVVESEKATVEVESPGTGLLGSQLTPPGRTVPITTTIGYILAPGEESPPLELDRTDPPAPAAPEQKEQIKQESPEKGVVRASPSARRLAQERGVDLAVVKGSGPQGRIVEKDVLAYLEAQAQEQSQVRATPVARKLAAELGIDLNSVDATPPGGRVTVEDIRRISLEEPALLPAAELAAEYVALSSIQRIAAERMSLSFRTAPHFYLSIQVDMSAAVAAREALLPAVEAKTGVRLSFSDFLVKAVGQTLRNHAVFNAEFGEGQFKRYQQINVGLAVDTPRGLVVPVFFQADRLSLAEIARRRAEVVQKAQDNRLSSTDLSHGTFTISNLGMFGIDIFSAIINPPQAAILAVGRIAKQVVVSEDDTWQIRSMMWLNLSVDHRVADGATAARFLGDLVYCLEQPYQMLV